MLQYSTCRATSKDSDGFGFRRVEFESIYPFDLSFPSWVVIRCPLQSMFVEVLLALHKIEM
jgi:hypothetical protein